MDVVAVGGIDLEAGTHVGDDLLGAGTIGGEEILPLPEGPIVRAGGGRALHGRHGALALKEHDGVLALGGGAVLADDTRSRLADQRVCWLVVGPEAAGVRVGLGAGRPLLLGNPRSQLVTLLRDRTPLYAEVADIVVDTDDRDPAAVVDEVAAALRGAGTGRSDARIDEVAAFANGDLDRARLLATDDRLALRLAAWRDRR